MKQPQQQQYRCKKKMVNVFVLALTFASNCWHCCCRCSYQSAYLLPIAFFLSFFCSCMCFGCVVSLTMIGYNGFMCRFWPLHVAIVYPAKKRFYALFIKWFNICRVSNFIKSTKTIERSRNVWGKKRLLAFTYYMCRWIWYVPNAFAYNPKSLQNLPYTDRAYAISMVYNDLCIWAISRLESDGVYVCVFRILAFWCCCYPLLLHCPVWTRVAIK